MVVETGDSGSWWHQLRWLVLELQGNGIEELISGGGGWSN